MTCGGSIMMTAGGEVVMAQNSKPCDDPTLKIGRIIIGSYAVNAFAAEFDTTKAEYLLDNWNVPINRPLWQYPYIHLPIVNLNLLEFITISVDENIAYLAVPRSNITHCQNALKEFIYYRQNGNKGTSITKLDLINFIESNISMFWPHFLINVDPNQRLHIIKRQSKKSSLSSEMSAVSKTAVHVPAILLDSIDTSQLKDEKMENSKTTIPGPPSLDPEPKDEKMETENKAEGCRLFKPENVGLLIAFSVVLFMALCLALETWNNHTTEVSEPFYSELKLVKSDSKMIFAVGENINTNEIELYRIRLHNCIIKTDCEIDKPMFIMGNKVKGFYRSGALKYTSFEDCVIHVHSTDEMKIDLIDLLIGPDVLK